MPPSCPLGLVRIPDTTDSTFSFSFIFHLARCHSISQTPPLLPVLSASSFNWPGAIPFTCDLLHLAFYQTISSCLGIFVHQQCYPPQSTENCFPQSPISLMLFRYPSHMNYQLLNNSPPPFFLMQHAWFVSWVVSLLLLHPIQSVSQSLAAPSWRPRHLFKLCRPQFSGQCAILGITLQQLPDQKDGLRHFLLSWTMSVHAVVNIKLDPTLARSKEHPGNVAAWHASPSSTILRPTPFKLHGIGTITTTRIQRKICGNVAPHKL